jgi:CTP-dependent riboflavin kinase
MFPVTTRAGAAQQNVGRQILMEPIVFKGCIVKGVGRYVELHVPGRNEIRQAPSDWPEVLCKGSLNVRIAPDGYPPLFKETGLQDSTKSLDVKCYPCVFEIAQHEFGNNKLTPGPAMPKRGSAQVWRAVLTANGHNIECWVLRRYGSGLADQLELLSDKHLRTEYGLEDGQKAIIAFRA